MLFSNAIITTEYFPPISTFWSITNAQSTLLEINENYQKKSTRNRTRILGVNGVEFLSVPLQKGKNNRSPIQEVWIAYEDNWQSKHLHSIKSAYGNAPYFEFYIDQITEILNSGHEKLFELNQSIFDFISESIGLEIEISPTLRYEKVYPSSDIDLRHLKFDAFESSVYTPKKYNQVFEEKHGFIGGLSILDLLMCKGPESILYI